MFINILLTFIHWL